LTSSILILGQNPGNNPKAYHYKNHTIDRLNKWADLFSVRHYSFMNCTDTRGVIKLKDVDFDYVQFSVLGYNKVIALGGFPSTVLDCINITHFRLPHPSPRNRVLNDKVELSRILDECKRYIHE
jgi:hypothetical protein